MHRRHNPLAFAFWYEGASFPFVLGMQTGCFPVINFTCLISKSIQFFARQVRRKSMALHICDEQEDT